ncbi:MAG: GNAT family N-acetyltransferase [Archangiaceae bacterium]|nr:GNAT family N-acetyltransferase [Archangiaceae bacterium]
MVAHRVTSAALAPFAREADDRDAAALAHLFEQLGHPCSEEQVRARLGFGPPDRRVLVAELDDAVVGLAVLELIHPLHRGAPEAVLTALVTDANTRHRGVARALLAEVSRRARQAGAATLYLRCHRRRDDAHAFYRAQGFDETHLTFNREL